MNGEPRQILLASPREPSGGSWLINALLELGVRVNFKPAIDRVWRSVRQMREPAAMWQPAPGGGWQLHPRADALRKWLPVLSRRGALHFRDDVAVFYVQDLPRAEFQGQPTVLFVRDPRDAIASMYQRVRPAMTLAEYAAFPHPETLLDAVAHWQCFVEAWLARDGLRVYRFEDYKADAMALLGRIVAELDIAAMPAEIASAALESSYEKARQAEQRYRAEHPGDDEVAMRAGRVGEWKDAPASAALSREIEARCAPLLLRLGYAVDTPLPAPPPRDAHAALRALAATLDAAAIGRARLQAREARQLLHHLAAFVQAEDPELQARLLALSGSFDDGSAYQFERIRELAQRVKARRAAPPAGMAEGSSAAPRSPPGGE